MPKKKTAKELKESADKLTDELEETPEEERVIKKEESDEVKELKKKSKKEKEEDEEVDTSQTKEGETEKESPPKTPKKEPKKKLEKKAESLDYKKKFSESTREGQKQSAKNRKINEAIDKAGKIQEPTDEEMAAEYPDWDVMDEPMKKLAKESHMGKQFRTNLSKAREEGKEIEKWDEKVDKFIDDPQTLIDNPALEGKLDEFSIYATETENTSVPLRVLVPAFLHAQKAEAKPKSKGKMFQSGTGGPDKKPKSHKLSLDEAMKLKKVDYKKYKEMLIAGKIEIDL